MSNFVSKMYPFLFIIREIYFIITKIKKENKLMCMHYNLLINLYPNYKNHRTCING